MIQFNFVRFFLHFQFVFKKLFSSSLGWFSIKVIMRKCGAPFPPSLGGVLWTLTPRGNCADSWWHRRTIGTISTSLSLESLARVTIFHFYSRHKSRHARGSRIFLMNICPYSLPSEQWIFIPFPSCHVICEDYETLFNEFSSQWKRIDQRERWEKFENHVYITLNIKQSGLCCLFRMAAWGAKFIFFVSEGRAKKLEPGFCDDFVPFHFDCFISFSFLLWFVEIFRSNNAILLFLYEAIFVDCVSFR